MIENAPTIIGTSDWLPLVTTIVAGFLILAGYSYQRRLTYLETLRQQKRDAHVRFVDTALHIMVAHIDGKENSDLAKSHNEFMHARWSLLLTASDGVAAAASKTAVTIQGHLELVDAIKNNRPWPADLDDAARKFEESFENLVLEMRKDCFPRTKFSKEELKLVLPFYRQFGGKNS